MFCVLCSAVKRLRFGDGGGGGGCSAASRLPRRSRGCRRTSRRREQALIARYNELVEAGADAETIEELKQQIEDTVRLQQARDVADQALSADWSDAKEAGGAIGAIAVLGALLIGNIIQKRKGDLMIKTTKAIVKGIEQVDKEQKPNPTNPVKVAIAGQLKQLGIYSQADDLINKLKVAR